MFTTAAMDDKPVSWIARPAGRRLAYAEYGAPDGRPVFYCHGFPSSHREALLFHETAVAAGVRLIAPDRPGYGASTPDPRRQIADWSADVAALAAALDLTRFDVIGVSGGTPYALACAHGLPEQVRACVLVGPLGPVYLRSVLDEMHWGAWLNLALARYAPRLAHALYGGPVPGLLARWPMLVERMRTFNTPPSDHAVLTGDTLAVLNRTIVDAMCQGARGARRDLLLYTQDWQLPYDRIATPTTIWHGLADGTVPASHAGWYAAHLPRATLHLVPEHGHYSLPVRLAGDILASLGARPAELDSSI